MIVFSGSKMAAAIVGLHSLLFATTGCPRVSFYHLRYCFHGCLQTNHYSQGYLTRQVTVGNVTSTQCVCAQVCACHRGSMEVIRQCVGVHYLLLPCGSQVLNSGYQAWLQTPLPTRPFHLPYFFLLDFIYFNVLFLHFC